MSNSTVDRNVLQFNDAQFFEIFVFFIVNWREGNMKDILILTNFKRTNDY